MQNSAREKALSCLKELGINFRLIEHPAVYTIEEMDALVDYGGVQICKNLFVRDAKGKKHFLIVMRKDKKADLKAISEAVGSSRFSFASEERLNKYLGLTKGAVTPLGVFNDGAAEVDVILDRGLLGFREIGVHPNENTATVAISPGDLIRAIEANGNKIRYIDI